MAKTRKTDTMTQATSKPVKNPGSDVDSPENADRSPVNEIDRLGTMKIGDLQRLFAEVVGEETRRSMRTLWASMTSGSPS